MKQSNHSRQGQTVLPRALILALLALGSAGCGKNKLEAPLPPSETSSPAAQATASVPPATTAAATPEVWLAQSQAALKAREYDQATVTLLTLQRARLNAQQAAAAAAQMRQLQGSLAQAIADGDPRAKAAADRLRQAAMER